MGLPQRMYEYVNESPSIGGPNSDSFRQSGRQGASGRHAIACGFSPISGGLDGQTACPALTSRLGLRSSATLARSHRMAEGFVPRVW